MGNNTSTRIERAERTGVLVLQKQTPPLSKVPERVLTLKIRFVDLSFNHITKVGPSIASLSTTLVSLSLAHNRLSELHEAIGSFQKLESLDVSHNASLSGLPPALGSCAKLKKLMCHHCAITALPPELGGLAALTVLLAAHNRLETLPPSFGALASLVELDLSSNRLLALPDELGSCPRIREVRVSDNPTLPGLPAPLLRDTPLDRVEVDPQLLGDDGLLAGDGADAYNARRKRLVDKELHAKLRGGDLKFST